MDLSQMKAELYDFYLQGDEARARAFSDRCFALLDERCREGMSVTEQKLLQYEIISREFTPVVFRHNPFYFETGALVSLSDGARNAKGYDFYHAGGWVYKRNSHLFQSQDPALWQRKRTHTAEILYLICGGYNDVSQHYNFNYRPILQGGLRSVYEAAQKELKNAKDPEETEFLQSVCTGMLTLKYMAEKFAVRAKDMMAGETDEAVRRNLERIARTAVRVPWEAPQSLYEALATLAFLRTALGTLEGIGPNTFGRLDKDLAPFYREDPENYGLISQFLLLWDCHYSHDMPMEGYADHELENTYTLGGCDDDGKPLYNEITRLFLQATWDHRIIFPKIKCRFSADSPDEYLEQICSAIVQGTTTVLLQNDDATISALVRAGRPLADARDYQIAGCWDTVCNQERSDHGEYLNLLKPFEYAVHHLQEKIDLVGIPFETFEGHEDFEELYRKTLCNCELLLDAKLAVKRNGGQVFHLVDRFPIYSSTLENCLENRRDYTLGGAKYWDEYQLLFGFPNITDSLLAIKALVFDRQEVTLPNYLKAVRANWNGYEALRQKAISCSGWGDGSEESCTLAARFNNDLHRIFQAKTGPHGGKVHMGHLTYTEIRWWGEKTLATPDGRKNGEVFAQGLTPSRLKRIPCVNDVINAMSALDGSQMAAGSVLNIMLPSRIPLDRCVSFLRAVATTATASLQLNCVSKETLLDAQLHPENYPDLIVRVTGFSAKFVSLSRDWQDEIITRNFYD